MNNQFSQMTLYELKPGSIDLEKLAALLGGPAEARAATQADGDFAPGQPAGKGHLFQIEHDIFVPDRPENRLLKSALDRVCRVAQSQENWRLAHELAVMLAEVPSSSQIAADFRSWREDRLMAHYTPVRPWCELVLGEYMPMALRGISPGMSLLFPMEKLFEEYVASRLSQALLPDAQLERQVAWTHLCEHQGRGFFRLRPDLLVRHDERIWVLDTKWKMVNPSLTDRDHVGRSDYGLNQSDFYQLFAYGHKYLGGQGDLLLIYPQTKSFTGALPPFSFSDGLTLWVVPFDLDGDVLDPAGTALPLRPSVPSGTASEHLARERAAA